MSPNAQLLTETMDLVQKNLDRWNQDSWRIVAEDPGKPTCGTAMCFGGWAVVADHGRLVVPDSKIKNADDSMVMHDLELVYARKDEIDSKVSFLHARTGKQVVPIYERAQRALRLTQQQADTLFNSDNSIRDLRSFVADLIAGRDIGDD